VLPIVFALLWSSSGFAGFADQSSKFARERVTKAKAKQTGFHNSRSRIRSAIERRESNRSVRAFWLSKSDFTCEVDFDLEFEIPFLVIITDIQHSGLIGAWVSEFLTRLVAWKNGGNLPTIDGIPCWDGPVRPPGNGGANGGGGGVAAVPEPATLAVWGVLGLASTGAGYRRLRRKAAS